MNKQNIIITGIAGFIGFHVAKALIQLDRFHIIGIDNLNGYYDIELKKNRLKELGLPINDIEEDYSCTTKNIAFYHFGIEDMTKLISVFEQYKPVYVIHLAAQAGVRYSLQNPHAYGTSNLIGFLNLLEACRQFPVQHLIYASSSSVYGLNNKTPYTETDPVEQPISLYAATKRANEVMAYSYSHLYKIPCTGLRFFTVYGPWGRPDMAYYNFTKKISANEFIEVYGNGLPERDFTFVDDIVEGIVKLIPIPPDLDLPNRVLNIGNNNPVSVNYFVNTLEEIIGKKAVRRELPMQPGDVQKTFADIDAIYALTGFKPKTTLKQGLQEFWNWYKSYHTN